MTCPIHVADLRLDEPVTELRVAASYESARLLVRLHGVPLGEVAVPLAGGVVEAALLTKTVEGELGDRIAAHLAADGQPGAGELPEGGLPGRSVCRRLRPPADRQPTVTVVIATRDRTDSLLRCLESVAALHYDRFDVVVVDSAPRDDATAEAVTELATRWSVPLRYVRSAAPGLAIAHNVALEAVTGELVAFTDDDVLVDADWLLEVAAGFEEAEVFCVTGLIVPAELETRAQCLVEEFAGFGRGYQARTFDPLDPPDDPLFPFTAGRFGSGANMTYRTAWLRERGGFDAALGAGTVARGGDDLAAFARVVRDGGVVRYEPAAIVRHFHRRDYRSLQRQAYGYGVGLGAYLMSAMRHEPAAVPYMLRRAVPALRHLLSSASVKNSPRSRTFPRELVWRERLGVLAGPIAYVRSVLRLRRSSR
jgi:glycosyltransferase involved in cell wall biosynthesis